MIAGDIGKKRPNMVESCDATPPPMRSGSPPGPAIEAEPHEIPVVPIIALAGLVVFGAVAVGAGLSAAWNRGSPAQQRDPACETNPQAPCDTIWTRACGRRCHVPGTIGGST